MNGGQNKKAILEDLMEKLEKERPGHGKLMEMERPIIAELIVKLKNREADREYQDYSSSSDNSFPGDSIMSSYSLESFSQFPQHSESGDNHQNIHPPKSPKKTRVKSPMDRILSDDVERETFRAFMGSHGVLENIEFWEACSDCERTAHGCASLAKKIINKLMKEIKETDGHPEKAQMDLALSSAVVAVRYELMMHKEETQKVAAQIVDDYVRDLAAKRVNLSSEKRQAFIRAVENPETVSETELMQALVQAQNEIKEMMEKKFLPLYQN